MALLAALLGYDAVGPERIAEERIVRREGYCALSLIVALALLPAAQAAPPASAQDGSKVRFADF